jgi:hypothetical protein
MIVRIATWKALPARRRYANGWKRKIFEFIETCLQLETHPEYHKDKFVNDPVCGMRFPITQAAGKVERNGSII